LPGFPVGLIGAPQILQVRDVTQGIYVLPKTFVVEIG